LNLNPKDHFQRISFNAIMKFSSIIFLSLIFFSCHLQTGGLVDSKKIDSLLASESILIQEKADSLELVFWKERIDIKHGGLVNEQKYAGSLLQRFYQKGRIEDLNASDSILKKLDERFRQTDPSISLALSHMALLKHEFHEAKKYVEEARDHDARKYPLFLAAFDVCFELGEYDSASIFLKAVRNIKDFNYLFRLSKWQHLQGSSDSALQSMLQAAQSAGQDNFSKQVALSNAGDFCMHAGKLDQATSLYFQSLTLNPRDFHSLAGLGRIALLKDHKDSLAARIFHFIQLRSGAPDVLLRLAELEQSRERSESAKEYAKDFVSKVGLAGYGRMYAKYLIDLYTGILDDSKRAEMISLEELSNRATPQTFAWYAWSLAFNNKNAQAYQVFQKYVSGRSLEAIELYWMGNLLNRVNKNYDALAFYEAAKLNRFDFPSYEYKLLQSKLLQ
jgi:Tfp pilus assembly protein PilF